MSTVHIDRAARSRWLVIMSVPLVALVVFIVTITATVRTTDSDMMGSLLAAESLVQGHWLRLDHYPDLVKTALGLGYRTELVNGHLFYSFPIGTSLLVAPFTPVLALFGLEVTPNDDKIQIGLAALAAVLVFTLLYLIARRFQPHWFSLLLATIFWFGTSFASTGASALWSHNFGSVLTLLGLLLLVDGLQRRQASYILWSGLVAGLAFIVRPQLALLAVGIAILLALRWRKLALPFVVTTAVIVASFSLFTQLTSGVWLPSYYLPQRLEGGSFWVAFAGNMVSPGRGLLVFTPILLIGILVAYNWRSLTRDDRALVLLGFGCMIAHWIAISRFPHWWSSRHFCGARPRVHLVPHRSGALQPVLEDLVRRAEQRGGPIDDVGLVLPAVPGLRAAT